MKSRPVMFALIAIVLVVGAWLAQSYVVINRAERDVLLMDTFVRLIANGRGAEKALDDTIKEMARLESVLSAHLPGSDVYRLNTADGAPVEVSRETIEVLERAALVYERTNGAFDVTVGAVLRAWGFGSANLSVPTAEALARAMSGVGFTNVEIDQGSRTVRLKHPETRLDLGGVAKGYIVDKAMEYIKARKVKHAIVDAGGDVRVTGGRPGQYIWEKPRAVRVGVQDPFSPEGLFAVVETFEASVLTSGDYERFFEQNGIRYTHIIDPRTGYPVRGLTSVTIVTEEAALADGIATAVMVMGKEEGLKLINSWDGVEGMLITEDEEVIMSTGMSQITNVLR